MKNLGNTLRELQENKQLPLRVVVAFLDIDPAIMSRIERGQRKASREQVVKLTKYFNVSEDELKLHGFRIRLSMSWQTSKMLWKR
jgi:transcriptional regulator with XRE-family HTH domain